MLQSLGRRPSAWSSVAVLTLLVSFAVALQLRGPAAQAANPGRPGLLAYTGDQDEELLSIDVTPESTEPPITLRRPVTAGVLRAGRAPGAQRRAPLPALAAGDTVRLTNSPGLDNQASGRVDGTLVFVSTREDPAGDLYLRSPSGSVRRVLASPGAESDPELSRDGSRVAFVSTRSGHPDLWVVDVDGTGLRQLTSDDAAESSPTWSPSGDRIAFSSTREHPRGRLYVLRLDDPANPTRLTDPEATAGDVEPSWSPDDEIAFTRRSDQRNSMVDAVEVGGDHDVRTVVDTTGDDDQPAWSPDGEWIAYRSTGSPFGIAVIDAGGDGPSRLASGSSDREPTWTDANTVVVTTSRFRDSDIWGVRPEGSERRDITARRGDERTPAYSPDGRHIAYSQSSEDGGDSIVVADADGANPRALTNPDSQSGVFDEEPSWSPDGERIAFDRMSCGPDGCETSIRTVRVSDGGDERKLSPDQSLSTREIEPAWSPDGRRIAFVQEEEGSESEDADLWLMDADGGNRRDLTPDAGIDDYSPSWSPDGDRIVFSRRAGGPYFLAVLTVATADVTRLTTPSGDESPPGEYDPAWSPDGTRVAFRRGPGRTPEGDIWLVAVDGGQETQVTGLTGLEGEPTWQPSADLSLTQSGPDRVEFGSPVTYLVTVANHGPVGTSGVALAETVPENVDVTSVVASQGTCTAARPVTCALDTLAADASATVRITVAPREVGDVILTATVDARLVDPDPSDNTAEVRTTVRGTDLTVTGTATPDPVDAGTTLTYHLTVTQNGPFDAPDTVLDLTPPLGAAVVSATAGETDGTCTTAGGIRCRWPDIDTGDGAPGVRTATVVVRPSRPGVAVATARVSSATGELKPDDNTATITTRVLGNDLTAALTVAPNPGYVGGQVAVHVTARNPGSGAARASRIVLALPAIACQTPAAGRCAAATVTLPVGDIPAGGTVSRDLTLTATAAGSAPVQATVRTDTPDLVPADDTARVTLRVRAPRLLVAPPLGPPGFVTLARGIDFPPGAAVTLSWRPGITANQAPVTVAANGTFTAQMLVIRRDLLGPRALTAAGPGFAEVETDFRVVPRTVEPVETSDVTRLLGRG